jgi:hypothetical protein
MSDNNLTFAELEAQHVELLPARTGLSMISLAKPGPPHGGTPGTPGLPGGATQGWNLGDPNVFFGHSVHTGGVGNGGAGGGA